MTTKALPAEEHTSYARYRDPEGRREYMREYNAANRSKLAAASKISRERTKEARQTPEYKAKRAAQARAHYWRNRDAILAKVTTPEHSAKRRERYKTDPDYRKKRNEDGRRTRWDILDSELVEFNAMYDEDCFYCGNEGGSVDHLTPRSRGGEDRLYNLVPCCISCNSSKGNKTPEEWFNNGFDLQRSAVAKHQVGSGTDSPNDCPVSTQDQLVY